MPKHAKLCSNKLFQFCSNPFVPCLLFHWNDTSTICLKVILQTRAIVHWGFLILCIQVVIVLQWFFCSLPSMLVCIISGGYTHCDFYHIFSAAMICLPSKYFVQTFLVLHESHDNHWRDNEKEWSEVFHKERFSCILISRFILLTFLSTWLALNILSLRELFRDYENFMSLFGCFQFWAPTCLPEVSPWCVC